MFDPAVPEVFAALGRLADRLPVLRDADARDLVARTAVQAVRRAGGDITAAVAALPTQPPRCPDNLELLVERMAYEQGWYDSRAAALTLLARRLGDDDA